MLGAGLNTLPKTSGNPSKSMRRQTPINPIAIVLVLGEMNEEFPLLEKRREKTRALKQAMMQELLTGRTRLV